MSTTSGGPVQVLPTSEPEPQWFIPIRSKESSRAARANGSSKYQPSPSKSRREFSNEDAEGVFGGQLDLQFGGAMFTSTRSMVTIGDRATLVGNTAKSVRGIHPFSRAAGRPEHAWNSGPALGPLNIPYYCNSKHI